MPLRHFLNDRIFQMEKYRSKLTNNLMDREEAYPVVFDAIACVESTKGNRVLIPIEADNDSERVEKITKKLKGIELYRKENRLHLKRPYRDSEGRETSFSHAEWLNAKFSITNPEYISRLQIRVFVITVNDKARNSFFFTTTDLPEDYFYYFASISDFEENPFDAIYLCKGNFTVSQSVKDDIKAAKGTTRYLKMKNAINPMKRQAFPFGRPRS